MYRSVSPVWLPNAVFRFPSTFFICIFKNGENKTLIEMPQIWKKDEIWLKKKKVFMLEPINQTPEHQLASFSIAGHLKTSLNLSCTARQLVFRVQWIRSHLYWCIIHHYWLLEDRSSVCTLFTFSKVHAKVNHAVNVIMYLRSSDVTYTTKQNILQPQCFFFFFFKKSDLGM